MFVGFSKLIHFSIWCLILKLVQITDDYKPSSAIG